MTGIQAAVQLRVGEFGLDVAFAAPGHGVTALYGRSGSGKTTILRWVAGLIRARSGTLNVNGQAWEDTARGIFIPVHKRSVGYVFQEAGLFPHLSIEDNLRYGLKRMPSAASTLRFDQAVDLLGIRRLLNQSPFELSGGERQRVAIARSLLINPKLLLFDEPLAALDTTSKREILPYIETVKSELRIPMIYVSHAIDEVMRLADHVVVVGNGQVQETGPISTLAAVSPLTTKLGCSLIARSAPLPFVISLIGDSGSGKTTLIESLIPLLKAKGYRIGAIKYDAHQFNIDHPGKDSHRFTQAGADTMVIMSKTQLALVAKLTAPLRIEDVISGHFSGFDIVLTEGYRESKFPKIRVMRSGNPNTSHKEYREADRTILAVAADFNPTDKTLPFLNLNEPKEIANFIEKQLCLQKGTQAYKDNYG